MLLRQLADLDGGLDSFFFFLDVADLARLVPFFFPSLCHLPWREAAWLLLFSFFFSECNCSIVTDFLLLLCFKCYITLGCYSNTHPLWGGTHFTWCCTMHRPAVPSLACCTMLWPAVPLLACCTMHTSYTTTGLLYHWPAVSPACNTTGLWYHWPATPPACNTSGLQPAVQLACCMWILSGSVDNVVAVWNTLLQ